MAALCCQWLSVAVSSSAAAPDASPPLEVRRNLLQESMSKVPSDAIGPEQYKLVFSISCFRAGGRCRQTTWLSPASIVDSSDDQRLHAGQIVLQPTRRSHLKFIPCSARDHRMTLRRGISGGGPGAAAKNAVADEATLQHRLSSAPRHSLHRRDQRDRSRRVVHS